MGTLVITRTFATTLLELRRGENYSRAFIGVKRRYEDQGFFLVHHVADNHRWYEPIQDPIPVSQEFVKQLVKLGLIERLRGRISRGGSTWGRLYGITQQGRDFKLPPEKYWINE